MSTEYKMELKEALEKSVELWKYLAEDGYNNKEQWYKYKQLSLYSCNDCHLCDLFIDHECQGCPLHNAGENCLEEYSLFNTWLPPYSSTSSRKAAAQGILDILTKALEQENNNEQA